MESGKSKPFVVLCEGGVQAVVKFNKSLTMPPTEHLFEWVAAAMAERLGLLVPPRFQIDVTEEFANATPNPSWRAEARASIGLVFGSGYLAQRRQPIRNEQIPPALTLEASEIIAFDVFIHNVDRRAGNPNLFAEGSRFVLYDHGDAFACLLPTLGASSPPETDALVPVIINHALFATMKGRGQSLSRIGGLIRGLTDEWFSDLRNEVPAVWTCGMATEKLDRLISIMQKRRDAVDEWLPIVEGVLR